MYECVSVPLTPGLLCDPTALANTAGSTPAATVGQCNGSGNGGGLVPAVPLGSANCSVGVGSTSTVTMAPNVDQCNGSANGGGAFLKCSATVINDVVLPIFVPIDTPTNADTGVYPPVVVTVVPSPGAAPAPTTTPPVVVVPLVIAPPTLAPVTVPPVVVPPGTTQIIVPVIVPPGVTPVIVPQLVPPVRPVTPRPAPTGNAGQTDVDGTPLTAVLLLGAMALGLTLGGRALATARQR